MDLSGQEPNREGQGPGFSGARSSLKIFGYRFGVVNFIVYILTIKKSYYEHN